MREHSSREGLGKLLAHPTRLAILIILATADRPLTLAELEKPLGVPRQIIYGHLEAMIREGIVLKRVSF